MLFKKHLPTLAPLLLILNISGCMSGREFWTYIIDERVAKPTGREEGEVDTTPMLTPHNIKVVYNDGATSTEVLVPVLTSGQQVVIDHKARAAGSSLSLVPQPPSESDKNIEDSYVKAGLPVNDKAPPISIVKTQGIIRNLVKEGNFSLALEHVGQILKRYPSHVESLRTQGSLLLKIGEREAALNAYRKAQEIEPDARVKVQIDALEKSLNQ